MEAKKSEITMQKTILTEQKFARISTTMVLVIMDSGVFFCTRKLPINVKNNFIEKECRKSIRIASYFF
jgi:hypothetical protein